ncbi:MAG: hypothetical protein QGF59_26745, partial [Pirellulaceae bacterium]|nr:hypothetical protein [Pirellulaceae bacterium]
MPADLDGPAAPAGSPGLFIRQLDDEITNPSGADPAQDFVEVWEFAPDFVTPANSTYTLAATVGIADFDYNLCNFSRSCLDQPGVPNSLDALPHYINYRAQYRNFGTHETLVGSFTEDVDTDHAGIHWFELRKAPGGAWSLFQDGTHAPDTEDRWMASAAMNVDGDIALGYSITSSTTFPSIRYTGRRASDPLGTMPQGEHTIIDGSGVQTFSSRWGDYSAMSVDPVNDRSFWYTQEYIPSGGRWATQIASFEFPALGASGVALQGPQLISANPNDGDIFDFETVTDPGFDNILGVAPRELTLRFNGGANLDESTFDGIRFTRAGMDDAFGDTNDVVMTPGFLGFLDPSNPTIVVARFAQTLPDDTYRIEIFGIDDQVLGITGLRSLNGALFEPRDTSTDSDTIDFDLQLGAQITAVVPQPVSRVSEVDLLGGPTGGTFTLTFDGATTTPLQFNATPQDVEDALQALSTVGGADGQNVVVTEDPGGPWKVAFQGHFAGAQATLTGDGSLLTGGSSPSLDIRRGQLSQARDQIIVYFNDDELKMSSATAPKFYRLIFTNDTARNTGGTDPSQEDDQNVHNPIHVDYDPVANKAVLTFDDAIPELSEPGTYRLRIGTAELSP